MERALKKAGKKSYKKKNTYKKKNNKKRSKMNKVSYMINRNPIQTADRLLTKLKYSSTIALAGTATPSITYFYVGNGPALPIETSGVRQPVGFDQFKQLYGKVRCHASSIKLKFMSTNTVASSFLFAAVGPSPLLRLTAQLSTITMQDVMALPYYKYTTFGDKQGINISQLNHYITTKKCMGVKSIEYSEDYATVTTSANKNDYTPALPWYWNIYISAINGVSNLDTSGCYVQVQVTYHCEFYDRFMIRDTNDIEPTGGQTGPGFEYGFEGVTGGGTNYEYGSVL